MRPEERALRAAQHASEERYQLLFESSPLPTWVFDKESHRILAVNEAAIAHYGFTRQEFLALRIEDLRRPEDVPLLSRQLDRRMVSDVPHSAGTWRHRRKDGAIITVQISAHGLTWEGHPAELVVADDITERQRAVEALKEREERLRQVVENISEVFFVMDATTGKIEYVSPAYLTVWGKSCDSLYANPQSFLEPVHPDDIAGLLGNIGAIRLGEDPGEIEFRMVRPDGQLRWIEARAVPVRNDSGEVYRVAGVCLDITERHAAQAALAESEARFRNLIDASFDGIDITEQGIVRAVNRGFCEMFGYSLDEVIGRPVLDFVADESRAAVAQRLADGTEGTYELIGKRKDGAKLFIEATAKVQSIGGRPGRITALRNLTERRELEAQFRQAQKMEAVGRLAGGVAHDFNNLLTVISSYSELLLEDLAPADPRRGDLEEILKASAGAATLTRQLLAFSRQQVLEPRVLNVNTVVAGAQKILRPLIGEDVELVTALAPDLGMIRADPGQIEQVIMNLAVNSRDAMPLGGRLTIETANVEVDEAYVREHPAGQPGSYVLLAVADNGQGMTEEVQAHVFEPFFTTKEQGTGTGLGLATVYGIVKQSGGFIWVDSELGQGTTFKTYLPRVRDGVDDVPAVASAGDAPHGHEIVLLVEDGVAIRAVTRKLLERQGYTVLEAADGAAALALAAAHAGTIDLLLTDVVMPKMSGRQLAGRLTSQRPGLKVLYISGYTDDAIVRHGMLEPGIAFLQKPFGPDILARKVRALLDAR